MNKLKMLLVATVFLAILTGTVAATCEPAPIPPAPISTPVPDTAAPGAVTLVGSKWTSGNLVFVDKDGNTIFTIDGTNRAFVMASAAAMNFTTGSTAFTSLGNFSSAQLAVRITNETGTNTVVYSNDSTLTRPIVNELDIRGTPSITWTSANLATFLSNETGTSAVVFSNQPSLSQPVLNSPDVRGTASITWTSANLATIVSDETGTGLVVYGTSPSLTTPSIASPTFTGGVLLATTAFNGGTGVVAIGNGSAPTYSVNTAQIYVSGGILYVIDGGNVTTILKYTKGRTSIPIGDTSASVTHSFGAAPSEVILSWQGETDPIAVAASTVYLRSTLYDATTFTVKITGTLSNRPSISWIAIP